MRSGPSGLPMAQEQILAGMRVVEAAAFVAAPLGGMTLAQLGADVIRIDTARRRPRPAALAGDATTASACSGAG